MAGAGCQFSTIVSQATLFVNAGPHRAAVVNADNCNYLHCISRAISGKIAACGGKFAVKSIV
jgi:hypothetical protein